MRIVCTDFMLKLEQMFFKDFAKGATSHRVDMHVHHNTTGRPCSLYQITVLSCHIFHNISSMLGVKLFSANHYIHYLYFSFLAQIKIKTNT